MRAALRIPIAAVCLVMGLGAKVLGLAPRHREIVSRILGEEHADTLTLVIGLGEILLAAWILSGRYPRLCVAVQIGLVATMNVIESTLARDLLTHYNYRTIRLEESPGRVRTTRPDGIVTLDLESPGRIVVIEGRRADWTPRPFHVGSCRLSLFGEAPFRDATPVLANAFAVENIDYRWERGRILSSP